LPYLQSIESLAKENIIITQNRPIIVHCSDQNYYYCKYHRGHGSAYRLFKEYFMASLIDCWELKHADFNIVQVLAEHLPDDLGIPKRHFSFPCFGSKKIIDTVILSKVNEDVLLKSKGKHNIKEDLLKISFFDMVFANEDRHLNNYNILLSQIQNEYMLYPIDHEACFNHSNIDRGMAVLTYEETLIYSTLFNKLYSNYELKDKKALALLKDKYYLCYRNCVNKIDEILATTPAEWGINIAAVSGNLKSYLTDEWFNECWREFLIYLQLFISDTH
jgi:hypothetical protein